MPSASEILADPFMVRYGDKDMLYQYYTCFPVDKQEKLYECVRGNLDACYSDKHFWQSAIWKLQSVPRILPQRYHLSYLQIKSKEQILKIHHDK